MKLPVLHARTNRGYAKELTCALCGKGFDVDLYGSAHIAGEDYAGAVLDILKNAEPPFSPSPKENGEGRNALLEVGAAKAIRNSVVAIRRHARASAGRGAAARPAADRLRVS